MTAGNRAVPTSEFSYQELVDIYNKTRVDYIVPMPMNSKRLEEYVINYDVSLDASIVTYMDEGIINGISMLGLRGDRAWITRLGVIPIKRRQGTGQFIMDSHIREAHQRGMRLIQLEVIKNNTPAHNLFLRNGFKETRELLVIRRPPHEIPDEDIFEPDAAVNELSQEEIIGFLNYEDFPGEAWTEEPPSLINAGSLRGFEITLQDGVYGQLVFQQLPFQLTHIKLCVAAHDNHRLAVNLLYHLHHLYPMQDAKVENVAVDDPIWQAYQHLGYVEAFRRIEMFNYFS